MTSSEIRKEVSPMVIWMADATIRGACKAINDTNPRLPHPYNRIDVETEIFFRMFDIYGVNAKDALIKTADGHNGFNEYSNFNYFDAFVDILRNEVSGDLKLRQPDWVLESL